eukprot:2917899-Prymnesium_polylepis.1
MRNYDDNMIFHVATPRSAASVHGVGREGDSYVAAVARYIGILTASSESKALQSERYRRVGGACAGRRAGHTARVGGRPRGAASDGAVLGGGQRISGKLASPSQPPSHVPTPLTLRRDGIKVIF